MGKAYSAAGQAAACYTQCVCCIPGWSVRRSRGCGPNTVCELSGHRFVSHGYGSTWWPLGDIYGWIWVTLREKIKTFLWMLLFPSGLFCDAVKSLVERFQESAKQAAAVQKLLPAVLMSPGLLSASSPNIEAARGLSCSPSEIMRTRKSSKCNGSEDRYYYSYKKIRWISPDRKYANINLLPHS